MWSVLGNPCRLWSSGICIYIYIYIFAHGKITTYMLLMKYLHKSAEYVYMYHCVKSVHIRSYSGPHFATFGLNTKRYSVSLRVQSECGKMQTRITPNTDTFYALLTFWFSVWGHSEKKPYLFLRNKEHFHLPLGKSLIFAENLNKDH